MIDLDPLKTQIAELKALAQSPTTFTYSVGSTVGLVRAVAVLELVDQVARSMDMIALDLKGKDELIDRLRKKLGKVERERDINIGHRQWHEIAMKQEAELCELRSELRQAKQHLGAIFDLTAGYEDRDHPETYDPGIYLGDGE